MSQLAPVIQLAGIGGSVGADLSAILSNAALRDLEARSIEQAARFDLALGRVQEQQLRRAHRLEAGELGELIAVSGLRGDSGSLLLRQLDLAKQQELEALGMRSGLEEGVRRARQQAGFSRFERSILQRAIPGVALGGALRAGSTILRSFFAPASPPVEV